MATFQTEAGKELAQLIARSLAFDWCGLDPDADDLRKAFAEMVYGVLMRADVASKGKSSAALLTLMKTISLSTPSAKPIFQTQVNPQEALAQKLGRLLLGFMPAEMRSLNAYRESLQPKKKGPRQATPPATSVPEPDKTTRETMAKIAALAIPVAQATSRWPDIRRLGDELQKRFKALKKLVCAGAIEDIETWLEVVPLAAAKSELVAGALVLAFKAASAASSAMVKSDKEIGSVVHSTLETVVAKEFVIRYPDKILVAEEDAYVPRVTSLQAIPMPVFDVSAILEKVDNDFSLRVLQQSRYGRGPLFIRAKGAQSSREDFVVFSGINSAIVPTALALDGRPEVYEVKPVDGLLSAVTQVTVYSWNYLVASIYWQCGRLLKTRKGTVSNSVMLPADPDKNTLYFPVLSIDTLAALASPAANPDKVVQIVEQLMSKKLQVAQYLAFPFMVHGLFGVIPYFLVDMKQLKDALTKVITTIVSALIEALLAYLAAKKLAEEAKQILDEIVAALEPLLEVVLFFAACVAFLVILVAIAAEAATALAAIVLESEAIAASIPILILIMSKSADAEPSQGGSESSDGEPTVDSFDVFLGNIRAYGMAPDKLSTWIAQSAQLFRDMWSVTIDSATVDVAPPG